MTTVTLAVLALNGVVLALAAALTLRRVVRGPRALDRSVAMDVLVAVVIAAMGLVMVWRRTNLLLPSVLVLSLLGFTSAVAIARLIQTRRNR